MSKFTKGPWTCVEVEFGDYQTGNVSFVVDSLGGKEIMVGSVANCSLIAAAPEMHEALEQLYLAANHKYPKPLLLDALQGAVRALTKARGKLPEKLS